MSAKGVRKTSFRRVKLAPFFNTTQFGSWRAWKRFSHVKMILFVKYDTMVNEI